MPQPRSTTATADTRPLIVLYVGDYDPAGVLIDRALERELRTHLRADIPMDFRRIAINEEQVKEHDLPTKPRKEGDKRSRTSSTPWKPRPCPPRPSPHSARRGGGPATAKRLGGCQGGRGHERAHLARMAMLGANREELQTPRISPVSLPRLAWRASYSSQTVYMPCAAASIHQQRQHIRPWRHESFGITTARHWRGAARAADGGPAMRSRASVATGWQVCSLYRFHRRSSFRARQAGGRRAATDDWKRFDKLAEVKTAIKRPCRPKPSQATNQAFRN